MLFLPSKILLLALFLFPHAFCPEKIQDLTNKNLPEYISLYPMTFIFFYSPTCRQCLSAYAEFTKLSNNANTIENPFILASYNAGNAVKLPIQIKSYPTFILFRGNINDLIIYNGKFTSNEMYEFLQKNTPSTYIKSYEDLNKISKSPGRHVFFHNFSYVK